MFLRLLPWLIGFLVVITLIAFLAYRSQHKVIHVDPEAPDMGAKVIPKTGPGIAEDGPIAPPSEEINVGTIKDEEQLEKYDDLTVIEGIGPAMQEILIEHGIHSYAKLATADPALLRDMLADLGLKYINPDSWPEQARMAAAGKWDQLEEVKRNTNFYA